MISVKLMRLHEEDLKKGKRCFHCQKALRPGDLVVEEKVVRDSYKSGNDTTCQKRFSHRSCYQKKNLRRKENETSM
jgi:hypothetical protein